MNKDIYMNKKECLYGVPIQSNVRHLFAHSLNVKQFCLIPT